MALDEALRARIQQTIEKDRIVLFMKGSKHFPQCGFSASVVGILKELGVPFETVNVLADPALREGIKVFSEWPTIPQLYVAGEFVGGADIVREMHGKGELQALVGAAKPEPAEAPEITITDLAVQAFRGAAAEADAGDVLRLAIDPGFGTDLFFGAKEAGDVVVTANGITLAMDGETARRARGLVIDFVQGPGGAGFKLDNPNAPARVRAMRAEELAALRTAGEDFHLVDVRTEAERAIARIEGARLLDASYARELEGLPKGTKIVFHCHHGGRSQAAAQRFAAQGFTNVWNLEGGIDAWSSIDPSVPRY
jgi:monothiol glutaredoxin